MLQAEKLLKDLISLRTDNKTDGNKACVDYICTILQENNVLYKRLLNPINQKENIIAGINIQGFKNINDGCILSGHMDTVGVNYKDWDSNPFEAVNLNGQIFGRGTVDMKYFIACTLALIPEFKKLKIPIFFLFSCDEETDVEGIQILSRFLQMRNIRPQYALVGEPTNFAICTSNKGYSGYTTTIKGLSAHSSCPECGINAAYIAAKIVSRIEQLNTEYSPQGTTLNVGIISGGEGRNSIPSEVDIEWEIRYTQESHKIKILNQFEDLKNQLVSNYKNSYIGLETRENLPPFKANAENRLTSTIRHLLQTETITLPHATEAGFLQKLGINVVVCGAGNEHLAHTSSEHISVHDLRKYQDFLIKLTESLDGKLNNLD